jgi:hypothetical protein
MVWKVNILPSADLEINDAIDWYGMQSPKAASNLMSDIAGRLNALEINPHFTKRYKDIYCLPLKRYPYMFHFQINKEEMEVRILGLVHTSLNPRRNWK